MKILITGIAGFIGSHLADKLSETHDVWGIDNFLTGHRRNLSDNVDCLIGDIVMKGKVEEAFEGNPDIVIHCAASYKDPDDWKRDIAINVAGTVNIIEACKTHGIKKLIYLQTSLCYGVPYQTPITLSHSLNPTTSYAITKTAAERFIMMSGVPYVSFRLANMYGPRNLSGPVPTFYLRIKNGEKCTVVGTRRDFYYVEDLIPIVVQAVEGAQEGTYHISRGVNDYAIMDLFDEISECLGVKPEYETRLCGADDVKTLMLENIDTLEDFEVGEFTPLHDGIRKAVDWYNATTFTETYTHLRNAK